MAPIEQLRRRVRLLLTVRAMLTAILLSIAVAAPALTADPAIRKIEGKHLTLFTDLPSSPEVDELPAVFDQAFPQWCARFDIDPAAHARWHCRGYLMKSRERFVAAGMLPDGLRFRNGFSKDTDFWLFEQTSPYYRRHLLLHEGTHSFMGTMLGGFGPPWYCEGMAELMATHRWQDGELTLDYFPRRRSEVPKLGRIEMVQTGFAARHALGLDQVLAFESRADIENDAYGWSWGLAAFLDGHPRYQSRFRELQKYAGDPNFNERLKRLFAADWPLVNEEWQLFVANLVYGYDFARMRLDPAAGKPLPAGGAKFSVAADRGWQSSGVRLEAGRLYRITASGRFQVADKPRVWWSEPGGVTLRYYNGLPLGTLVAAVRPDVPDPKAANPLIKPIAVGTGVTIAPRQTGTLYLRINDSAGRLGDNAGKAAVEIQPAAAATAKDP